MDELEFLQKYLARFGHLPSPGMSLEEGIKSLQNFAGLEPTGEINEELRQLINTPRCGCSDALTAAESRWRKTNLTYAIMTFVTGPLSQDKQRELIRASWDSWQNVCGIKLTEIDDPKRADITIQTGRGKGAGMDGRNGTLAYAYLPNGDRKITMVYDLDELWTLELFRAVTCHEQGHLLGLGHSTKKSALMYPYANTRIWTPQEQDDIVFIQQSYGKPTGGGTPPPPTGKKRLVIEYEGNLTSVKVISIK